LPAVASQAPPNSKHRAEVPNAGSHTAVAGIRRVTASSPSIAARIKLATTNTRPTRWTVSA